MESETEELYPKGLDDLGIFTQKELEKLCQQNIWLKHWGVEFEEDPFMEEDYKYTFMRYVDLAKLKRFFKFGNWAIRQGAIYESLCFINQINGGDEWWTIKKFPDGRLLPFESVSWRYFIDKPNMDFAIGTYKMPAPDRFEKQIQVYLKATYEQCKNLDFEDEE